MSVCNGTVLVVEDAGPCATTLEIALARVAGLRVRVVSTVEDACAALADDAGVCAVVTDLHIGKESGLDLIRWMRRGGGRRLPIIVISGDSDPETPAASLRLGADAYFAKPFSPAEVRHKLEDLIHGDDSSPL
ncbi:MAG TPA: response regulator [Beijerinckiaceae bacterium]|nr:response regulator [Beijerinckiaceae bacterium]